MGDFYETGIEIWAGFGPVGITVKRKRFGSIMRNFFKVFKNKKKRKKKTLKKL